MNADAQHGNYLAVFERYALSAPTHHSLHVFYDNCRYLQQLLYMGSK